ncbi:hypothetical protein FRB94_011436 [Tulasnella sp. JGI-2019a]|nr:hypothetical protein FRB94_011436 [Tulasnella sp. JGI-2019a]
MLPLLPLNKTTLLFLRSSHNPGASGVVQVTVQLAKSLRLDVGTCVAFSLAQTEISNTIESLLLQDDTSDPFPTPATIQGRGYLLFIESELWTLGESWYFGWGEYTVQGARRKWKIAFLPLK